MTRSVSEQQAEAPSWVLEKEPVQDRPSGDTFEVTVFGKGVGESIVLHLGLDNWCIVDSLRSPKTGRSAPVDYLEDIGVSPREQVRSVVGTHLHMDHITDLRDCVKRCQAADVALPAALYPAEVRAILKLPPAKSNRRLIELAAVKDAVDSRDSASAIRWASAGTRLLDQDVARYIQTEFKISAPPIFEALSPSDLVTERVNEQMKLIIDNQANSRRLPKELHNEVSIVIAVNVGFATVLLGADLERSRNPGESWDAVKRQWPAGVGRASILKVPHHGSYNADSPELWDLLTNMPLAVLAPHRSSGVPRRSDLARLLAQCGAVFVTGRRDGPPDTAKNRAAYIALLESGFNPIVKEFGVVRLRRPILKANAPWRAAFFGAGGSLE